MRKGNKVKVVNFTRFGSYDDTNYGNRTGVVVKKQGFFAQVEFKELNRVKLIPVKFLERIS